MDLEYFSPRRIPNPVSRKGSIQGKQLDSSEWAMGHDKQANSLWGLLMPSQFQGTSKKMIFWKV